ncbi:MAG: acyl-CoA dehydrogenase [Betaproteobacteria bacterium]|jgi:acyl-CoA dehydrogenase|nr:Acyl-CoA dehydrogenase [Rhodocyclaceae bacterium]
MTTTDNASVGMAIDRDHADLRDAVKRLCARFPGRYWQELDEKNAYPDEFVNAMGENGFLAALIPEQYGGSGLPFRAAQVILQTVHEEGCSAIACFAQMYTMGTMLKHGSEDQKMRYLPKIATGELRLQAFGVTEPGAGTETLKLKTRATRAGDHYLINGQKIWTSRVAHSDLMLLLARTTPYEEMRHKKHGLSVFLVDVREGVKDGTIKISPIPIMTNHLTYEVFFNNARVPVENRIGEEGEGFSYILSSMNAERTLACGMILGNGYWFIRKAVDYANQRVVFGRPISANQGIQFPIAHAYANLEAADMMARRAACLLDAGRGSGFEANTSKHLAAEAAWEAAEVCMQTYGGFGVAREFDVERVWRDTRHFRTAPISTNLILAFIGQNVLGMPKSY